MDTPLPVSKQPQQAAPPAPVVPVVPIAVSDQPLTLDPNQMPITPSPLEKVQVKAMPTPVGGVHKERAPSYQAPVSEYLRPTDVAPQLPPEVVEAGVEVVVNKEHPQLDDSHKAAGIEHAQAPIPVVIPQTTSIYLPYSPGQAKQVEKESSVGESRHWLAQLTEYIISKFQSRSA